MKRKGVLLNSGYHIPRKQRGPTLPVSAKDDLMLHLWAEKDNTTVVAQTHFAILAYSVCRNNNHVQRIKELEDKVRLLALLVRKYQIRCGEVAPEKK